MVWENVESSIFYADDFVKELSIDEFSKKYKTPSQITITHITDLYSSKYDDKYYCYVTFKSDDNYYCDWSFGNLVLTTDGVCIAENNNLYSILKYFYDDIPVVVKVDFNELKDVLINKSFIAKCVKRPYSKGFYNSIIPMET